MHSFEYNVPLVSTCSRVSDTGIKEKVEDCSVWTKGTWIGEIIKIAIINGTLNARN